MKIILFIFALFFSNDNTEIYSEEQLVRDHAPPNFQVYYWIDKYSELYNVPKNMVLKCAELETGYKGFYHWDYNPKQISVANARGPLQILEICARDVWGDSIKGWSSKEINEKLLNDIEWNILTGIRYMKKLYNLYDNWLIVFSVYNQGWYGEYNINTYARKILKGA